jgi:hypothetical protein
MGDCQNFEYERATLTYIRYQSGPEKGRSAPDQGPDLWRGGFEATPLSFACLVFINTYLHTSGMRTKSTSGSQTVQRSSIGIREQAKSALQTRMEV